MSTHDAIFDMSRTLQKLLQEQVVIDGLGKIPVTVDSPLRLNLKDLRLNIFLYQILQDEFRRNSQRVVLGTGDETIDYLHEPLALRLHYLVTAFAPSTTDHSGGPDEHRILGKAMQVLHANQAIPRAALQGSLRHGVARLRAQPIQLVLLNHDVEHIKHIWGDNSVPLRASVAYEAAIVFIERDEAPRQVRRVKTRHVKLMVVVPYLERLEPRRIAVGAKVTVSGANLDATGLRVRLRPSDAKPADPPLLVEPEVIDRRHLVFTVPPGLHGPVTVRLQIDDYTSTTAELEVL